MGTFDTNKDRITAAFVQQFHDSFEIATQQKESRLQATVKDRGNIVGSAFTVNDMGTVEMNEVTERYGDTVWDLPDSGTRQALMADYDLFIPVPKTDLRKLLANPQGPYMDLTLSAANRKKDQVIYTSLLADVKRKTSDNGAYATVPLPTSQKIAASGAGMTKAKIIAAKTLFRRNECDEQNGEELFFLYDSYMLNQILSDTTLTSADFMTVKMLQDGEVNKKWCGFTWVAYENLKTAGTTTVTRTTCAYTKSALHFGTGAEYNVDIGPRRDKKNVTQISVDASYGAARANENKVVAIDFIQ
ncbi:hypothetical protein ABN12_003209 [Salmonella enterica subsp. enterica serovar Mississippi]|uniref:Uncharacterized protein n=1 Tax=Salmonella enterica subsp. enterica serovar Cardoner TaxID=2564309 RepID=A0A5W3RV34_SALET|nr:hypothetical protein [Salmonella enterica subsp. enterica serovar Agbeni]EAC1238166.1 hypothetical protein [Salmonella enterica subsp. enterica]EAO9717133.1 hypothetical protein [Salmonella enterica]EBF8123386.1 hypothetical protein [Salmonella enterica subsp. enterica serovar Aba]EBU7763828.1 hypothetical protein [Salmonella enterica subsp. enterica serovar Rovaniemi]EBU8204128.1 hypothetical protein [Salmonella enterica subsp. enterica serovar Cardoner]EBW9544357.1 hypothetical protein [